MVLDGEVASCRLRLRRFVHSDSCQWGTATSRGRLENSDVCTAARDINVYVLTIASII